MDCTRAHAHTHTYTHTYHVGIIQTRTSTDYSIFLTMIAGALAPVSGGVRAALQSGSSQLQKSHTFSLLHAHSGRSNQAWTEYLNNPGVNSMKLLMSRLWLEFESFKGEDVGRHAARLGRREERR